MGVYRRFRAETDFDILELSDKLKRKIAVYCMNENRVPKRWRFIFGVPTIDYADKIRENVLLANDIYANTEDLLIRRREYQTKAVSYCNLLQCNLTDMEEILDGVTCENLREIIDILDQLMSKIIKWRKNDKVISC